MRERGNHVAQNKLRFNLASDKSPQNCNYAEEESTCEHIREDARKGKGSGRRQRGFAWNRYDIDLPALNKKLQQYCICQYAKGSQYDTGSKSFIRRYNICVHAERTSKYDHHCMSASQNPENIGGQSGGNVIYECQDLFKFIFAELVQSTQ